MRVVIAGGHGKIALLLERLLAERGDQAVGLIRNPAHVADVQNAGAEAVVCDLEAAEVGYVEQPLTLRSADKELLGFMYAVANPNLLDESLRPYDWYKALVVTGAKEHNLPVVYVKELEGVESVNDPNAVRAERNRKLLN